MIIIKKTYLKAYKFKNELKKKINNRLKVIKIKNMNL